MKPSRLFSIHQWLLLVSAPLLVGASVYYLVEIIPQLQAAFFGQATCGCETIISFTHNPYLTLFLSSIAVVAFGIIVSMAYSFYKQIRATRRHLATLDIHSKELMECDGRYYDVYTFISSDVSIFTAGILHPRIYISSAALTALNAVEKESVLLHEIGHIARYDVLKRYITNAVLYTLRWLPGKKRLQESVEFAQEHAADEFAAHRTDRTHVMGALMKLLETQQVYTPSSVAAFVVNEARLEHLLLEPIAFPVKMALAGLVMSVGMMVSTSAVFAAGFGILDYVENDPTALSAATCVDATMSVAEESEPEEYVSSEFCADLNNTPANMSTEVLTPIE